MLPVRTPEKTYHTLDEIRLRKEELATDIQHDNEQFTSLWRSLFQPKQDSTKGEMIASLVTNSITAVDTFLLLRKLYNRYGRFFDKKKR